MGRTYRQQLFDVALDQYGFVTTGDAHELEIPVVELGKLAHRGKLERIAYGIYRFPELPVEPLGQYMLATLWTGRRGALSHETVLDLHELCEVNPTRIHLTVEPGYSPRRAGGELYVVHHQELAENQLGWFEGIRTVTPRVAIEQCIATGTPTYLMRQAIMTARDRGLILRGEHDRLLVMLKAAVRV